MNPSPLAPPPCVVCKRDGAYTLPEVVIGDSPAWVCSADCAYKLGCRHAEERMAEPCISCGARRGFTEGLLCRRCEVEAAVKAEDEAG